MIKFFDDKQAWIKWCENVKGWPVSGNHAMQATWGKPYKVMSEWNKYQGIAKVYL